MNVLMLLAQGAMNMADSLATANPVLTPVSAPEMNMLDMAVKGGWIMIVLGVLSVVCFYILFERNYMIRKAGKEDPMFMERIKDYIHSGEIKAAIQYCRTMNTPSARMIEKGISRLGRPINDVQVAIENVVSLTSLQEKAQCNALPLEVAGKSINKIRIRISDNHPVGRSNIGIIIKVPVFYFTNHTGAFCADICTGRSHHLCQIIIESIFYITIYSPDRTTVALYEHLISRTP